MVPAPIQRLAPLMTHSPPSSRAVVSRPPAMSEPWSGSVRAKAPSWVKAVRPGSQRCLLLLRAQLVDHADDQFVVDAHQRREGHVGAGHLDVHEALEELGRAVRLQPAQPVFAQLREQPEGELLAVPVVDGCGPDPGLQEVPDLLVAALLVRRQQVHDVHEVGVGKRRRPVVPGFRCGGLPCS